MVQYTRNYEFIIACQRRRPSTFPKTVDKKWRNLMHQNAMTNRICTQRPETSALIDGLLTNMKVQMGAYSSDPKVTINNFIINLHL